MSKRQLTFYFTASIAAKDQYIKNYTQIIESVKANDINIIADHILNTSEPEVNSSSREKRLAFHRQLEEWIHKCDALIAETSYPSISVGYEISLALRVGKPVLVLYSGGEAPSLLAHHSDEKILTEKYRHDIPDQNINVRRAILRKESAARRRQLKIEQKQKELEEQQLQEEQIENVIIDNPKPICLIDLSSLV